MRRTTITEKCKGRQGRVRGSHRELRVALANSTVPRPTGSRNSGLIPPPSDKVDRTFGTAQHGERELKQWLTTTTSRT